MKPLRLALLQLVLGAWLAVSLCTAGGAVLAIRTARGVESADTLAPRVQAAAFTSAMFRASTSAQLALAGVAALIAAWPRSRARVAKVAVLVAAGLVAILAFAVLPRVLEAVPDALRDGPGSPASEAMRAAHRTYFALDVAKTALVAIASLAALRSRERP